MAFHIKQANYEKRPTAEQRKVLRLLGIILSPDQSTRIVAHLKICEVLAGSEEKRRVMKQWQLQRKIDRAHSQAICEEARRQVPRVIQEANSNAGQ